MLLVLKQTGMAGLPLLGVTLVTLVNIDIVVRSVIRIAGAGEPDEFGELTTRAITGNGRRAGWSAAFFFLPLLTSPPNGAIISIVIEVSY